MMGKEIEYHEPWDRSTRQKQTTVERVEKNIAEKASF